MRPKAILKIVFFLSITSISYAQNYTVTTIDGKAYRAKKMPDGRIWMTENLNYESPSGISICYNNDPNMCERCGVLYDWETAMMVCPKGWHLPNDTEWRALSRFSYGKKLNAKYSWNSYRCDADGIAYDPYNHLDELFSGQDPLKKYPYNCDGNGTDDYGFSALACGQYYLPENEGFVNIGKSSVFWSATADNNENYRKANAWMIRNRGGKLEKVYSEDGNKSSNLMSVRCVKN